MGRFLWQAGSDPRATVGSIRFEGPHGETRTLAAADLAWLEDPAQRLLYAGADDVAERALARLAARVQAQAFASLAVEAARFGDRRRAERALDAAVFRELDDDAVLDQALAAVDRCRDRALDRATSTRLEDAEVEVVQLAAQEYWERLLRLPDDTPPKLRLSLLRSLIEHDPRHEGALAMVVSLLPQGAYRVDRPGTVEDWLDFLDVAARVGVELLYADDERLKSDPWGPRMQQRANRWRPDLVLLRSQRLAVISPLREPGRIARCLLLGERVTAVLDQLHEFATKPDLAADRLELHLYETAAEYEAQASLLPGVAEWTAGHYSPSEGLARLYLPDDLEASANVQRVFAHELTHQWTFERSPLRAGTSTPRTRGFWIAEGFASLVESFQLEDGANWSCERHPEALEIVAALGDTGCIAWEELLRLDHIQFGQLGRAQEQVLDLPSVLGRGRRVTPTGKFYAQATAVCHYLFFGCGPAERRALLEYLGAYLSGRDSELDVVRAFGMSPGELGMRTMEFARQRVVGSQER